MWNRSLVAAAGIVTAIVLVGTPQAAERRHKMHKPVVAEKAGNQLKPTVSLPRKAPIPKSAPVEKQERATKDAGAPKGSDGDEQDMPATGEAPLPELRPNEQPDRPPLPSAADRPKVAEPAAAKSGRRVRFSEGGIGPHNSTDMPAPAVEASAEERQADEACRARLTGLGVVFEPQAALSDPIGCRVPFPIFVSKLGATIAVEPAAVMNCAMTEAAAKFSQSVISPSAKSIYGADLKAIANASAYVCRPRHGTNKLSEHAFGNALDMARFVLTDGTAIDVKAGGDAKSQQFLDGIRKAACGPFKTVLGPGSDADHALHFHLDLEKRRNGGTFCQ